MSDVIINEENGFDIIEFKPEGKKEKIMHFRIKDNVIQDAEIVGGCSGNHKGIISLIKGMNLNEVVEKLKGITCGARATSCPDQISVAIKAYIEQKQTIKV